MHKPGDKRDITADVEKDGLIEEGNGQDTCSGHGRKYCGNHHTGHGCCGK